MPDDGPTYESFQEELDLVIARHNELFSKIPSYPIAMLLHEADHLCGKYNIALDLEQHSEEIWVANLGEKDVAAVLGVQGDPSRLEGLERDLAMIDHRGTSPAGGRR